MLLEMMKYYFQMDKQYSDYLSHWAKVYDSWTNISLDHHLLDSPDNIPTRDAPILEQAYFFDKFPYLVTSDNLNNFHFNCPGGQFRMFSEGLGHSEKTLEEVYSMIGVKLDDIVEFHSDKRLGSAQSVFYSDVQKSIVLGGKSVSKIKKMNSDLLDERDLDKKSKLVDDLNEYLILEDVFRKRNVYLLMRDLGYTHYDIVM